MVTFSSNGDRQPMVIKTESALERSSRVLGKQVPIHSDVECDCKDMPWRQANIFMATGRKGRKY